MSVFKLLGGAVVLHLTLSFTAQAKEIEFTNAHTGETVLVDTESEHDLEKLDVLARDWRAGIACPISRETINWVVAITEDLKLKRPRVYVLSGYRTLRTNRKVGGVSNSQHMECNALDIMIDKVSVRQLYKAARRTQVGGLGFYPDKHFIHIDSGRVRRW